MGFDFTVIAPLLSSHCGVSFVFGCGVSFLVSSSVFLSMIVQQLVVILVFSQEGVRARPSTPPLTSVSLHGTLLLPPKPFLLFCNELIPINSLRVWLHFLQEAFPDPINLA